MNTVTMKLLESIRDNGGTPYIVGGYVRDLVMGKNPKDIDVEVFNMTPETLQGVITAFVPPNQVGMSFGIIKADLRPLGGDEIDFSMPRRESKQGQGHKGFMVEFGNDITPLEASLRRDFTFNAMFMNPFTGEIVDLHGGMNDIKNKIIRHTSEHFSEDPLRVLRGIQFAARFGFTMAPETIQLCYSIRNQFASLAKERIFEEFNKMLMKGKYISSAFSLLIDTGWIENFPVLRAMNNTQQDLEWHPEGNVFAHTGHVCDAAAEIAERENLSHDEKIILMYSALLHDAGKPSTTEHRDNRIISHGHESAGVDEARKFFDQINPPDFLVENVLPLIGNHLAHIQDVNSKTVRRLAVRISPSNIRMLCHLIEADFSGRPPLPKGLPVSAKRMLDIADGLHIQNNKPSPLVLGRHLLHAIQPGPELGKVLKIAFEAQLDGAFDTTESGIDYLKGMGYNL